MDRLVAVKVMGIGDKRRIQGYVIRGEKRRPVWAVGIAASEAAEVQALVAEKEAERLAKSKE